MVQQILGALEAFGQFFADRILDHALAGKADQRLGFADLDIAEHRLPQDGRIFYPYGGEEVDIRMSTLPLLTGEKVVLRLLNDKRHLLQFSELAFSARNDRVFRRLCRMPGGLLLLTGPVNSGKTTTLYAALQLLDAAKCNIVTLEDPVEYKLRGINQLQVNHKVQMDFAAGLRAVLRQDPDAIMLGEIRDEETAEMAVRAALTGHLLFSTLHTGSAVGAVSRMLEMGIAPYLFAASVLGVVAQRLVRRLCPNCRHPYYPEADSREAAFLGEYYHPGICLYHGDGCPDCGYSGYRGRLAVQELLCMDENLRQAVLEESPTSSLQALAAAAGMASLREDGIAKALAGLTSLSEVGRVLYGEL